MKNLPIDVLRSFVTITELGGYTHAAELLGRSQPAISLQMKRLEALVESPVFIRNGHQLKLSKTGSILFDSAKKILSINDDLISKLTKSEVSGRIRLGLPSEFAIALLPKIIGRFSKTYPSVTLEVTSAMSKILLADENKDNFDLILTLDETTENKGADQIKIDELVWVSSSGHDAHNRAILPLILSPEPCIYRSRTLVALNEINREYQIVYTSQDLSGIESAIQVGLGITVLAKSTVPASLKIIKPSESLPRLGKIGIKLISRKGKNNGATNRLSEYINSSLAR